MFFFTLLIEKRWLALVCFLLSFSLLIYGLFVPEVVVGAQVSHFDKIAHFCAFFVVFLLGRFASHGWIQRPYWLLPVICAFLLEYLQGRLVVTRTFSWIDISANLLGVAAAVLLWAGFWKLYQSENTSNE